MGRPESPLDPAAGPVQRLACELRQLRREAGGMTYRAMADRVEFSAATLSESAAGERLPSLAVVLAYVRACGANAGDWEGRWRRAAEEEAGRPAEDEEGATPPYRGLARFEPGDSGRFFGRDQLVADLAELVLDHRFVAVVGTSGSGKSSLLRAGLVPTLRGDAWPGARPVAVRILTPGEHPARTHARALAVGECPGDGDTWVIVDQFEEVFTLCQDPVERARFLDRLLAASRPGARLRVVIAVRADLYGRLGEHRGLADALRGASLLVAPMSTDELREAVVKPAATQGLTVERALADRIVADVSDRPGGLPLMSHALLETWRRRRGRTLTLKGYEAAGGVRGAITQTAEDLYGSLSPQEAAIARQVMLRLIAPGEDSDDTSRPAPRAELDGSGDTTVVLDRLARARLITLDDDTVDLAHEALITAWPRLRDWIDRDREVLRRRRLLTEAALAWEQLDRDSGALYRGARLTAAEEVFTAPARPDQLTSLERAFLATSVQTRDAEQRDLTRTNRRLRSLTAALAALLVLAVVAAGLAFTLRHSAVTAQDAALSRQLAAQSAVLLDTNPDLAALLAVQAYRTSPTAEAVTGLYTAAALPLRHRLDTGGQVWSVAFSPDGRTLATGCADTVVRLWDTATGRWRATLAARNYDGSVETAVAFSPDGRTLAVGGEHGLKLWDVATGRVRATLTVHGVLPSVAFSPDGRTLAAAQNTEVDLWDVASGRLRRTLKVTQNPRSVAFSPDGRLLAAGSGSGTALWDAATGRPRPALPDHTGTVWSVAFSPDGRTLASGGETVRLYDMSSGADRVLPTGHTGEVTSLAFSPDGRTLATTGNDRTLRLTDLATGRRRVITTGHTDGQLSVAFDPDGRTLATGSGDGTARLWQPDTGRARTTLNSRTGPIRSVALSPDGHTLATGGDDGKARLWNTATGTPRATLTGHTAAVRSLAFSPDGRSLATGSVDRTIRLWNVRTATVSRVLPSSTPVGSLSFTPDGRGLLTRYDDDTLREWNTVTGAVRVVTTRHAPPVSSIALSPDGRTLAAGTFDLAIRLQDLATGATRATLTGHTGIIEALAFSPDGRTLASGGEDGTVRLWDTGTGRQRAVLTGDGQVWSVAFSADGRTVASGGDDGTVRLWDAATGRLRDTLTGHAGPVRSVAFSPDDRTLATGGDDGTARLWSLTLLDPQQAVDRVCTAVHRDLTPLERDTYVGGHWHGTCPG